jgi:ABC-type sugar transport system substrate-binding protein/predicted MPP superfamily phosphohydrolase
VLDVRAFGGELARDAHARLAVRELDPGELQAALAALTQQRFRAPRAHSTRSYSRSTLERWYYAYKEGGLVALRPQARADKGRGRDLTIRAKAPRRRAMPLLCGGLRMASESLNYGESVASRDPEARPALFRWLHLSDVHFGHPNTAHRWDQKLVLDALRRDIRKQVDAGMAPDAILVTGDIAFSGTPKQYKQASRWLLALATTANLTPADLFVVPGNHDVDRSSDQRDLNGKRLLERLRSGIESFDEAMSSRNDRALLANRMKAFRRFARTFPSIQTPHPSWFWVHPREAREGLQVRLVGLNTAVLAADDTDRGKLRLGRRALADTLTEVPSGQIVLVLTHHPLRDGWLYDEHEAEREIRNRAHVHLSGHRHKPDSEEVSSGNGAAFVRVAAGAVHGDRMPEGVPASHGYNFSAIVLRSDGDLALRVWPRRWSDDHRTFVMDTDGTPRNGASYVEYRMGVHDARPEARPPVNFGIVIPSADDPFNKELRDELAKLLRDPKLARQLGAASVDVIDYFLTTNMDFLSMMQFALADKVNYLLAVAPGGPILRDPAFLDTLSNLVKESCTVAFIEDEPQHLDRYGGRVHHIRSKSEQGVRFLCEVARGCSEPGPILLLNGPTEYSAAKRRRAAYNNELSKLIKYWKCKVGIVQETLMTWTRDEARAVTHGAIEQFKPGVFRFIFAANDAIALGAADVVLASGAYDKTRVFGFDGIQEALDAINDPKNPMIATIHVAPANLGYQAVHGLTRRGGGMHDYAMPLTKQNLIQNMYKKKPRP